MSTTKRAKQPKGYEISIQLTAEEHAAIQAAVVAGEADTLQDFVKAAILKALEPADPYEAHPIYSRIIQRNS